VGGSTPLALPTGSTVTLVSGQDYISLFYGQPIATLTIGGGNGAPSTNVDAPYPLNKSITVSAGQPFVISDCDTANLFRVDTTGTTSTLMHVLGGGNNAAPANITNWGSVDPQFGGNTYASGSVVMTLEMPTFFLGTEGGVTSLYRWDTKISSASGLAPMVPNVQQMRVVFGVDTGSAAGHLNQANAYMTGDAVTLGNLWRNVVSAQVHMVIRSDEAIGAGTTPVDYTWDAGNQTFVATTASDSYMRRVYVANVALRTRVPIM
jgi:hypothetical protein